RPARQGGSVATRRGGGSGTPPVHRGARGLPRCPSRGCRRTARATRPPATAHTDRSRGSRRRRSPPPVGWSAADSAIDEAAIPHGLGVVDVATVHQYRAAHGRLDPIEIETAEFVPFGHQ